MTYNTETIKVVCSGFAWFGRNQFERLKGVVHKLIGIRLIVEALGKLKAGETIVFEHQGHTLEKDSLWFFRVLLCSIVAEEVTGTLGTTPGGIRLPHAACEELEHLLVATQKERAPEFWGEVQPPAEDNFHPRVRQAGGETIGVNGRVRRVRARDDPRARQVGVGAGQGAGQDAWTQAHRCQEGGRHPRRPAVAQGRDHQARGRPWGRRGDRSADQGGVDEAQSAPEAPGRLTGGLGALLLVLAGRPSMPVLTQL
jgi:hypothetical protein